MDYWVFSVFKLLMISMLSVIRVGSLVQDHCDTTLWDSGSEALGVRDIGARCAEGHIRWRAPRGALRIILEPRIKRQRVFEACFLASIQHAVVKFSLDDPSSGLRPLVVLSPGSESMSRELCFRSERDPVVLYVESERLRESLIFGAVHVDYDIRYLPGPEERQDKDCRPCTEKELLEAACSSDLVFSGTIDHVMHYPEVDETALHLKVKRVIRQRNGLISDSRDTSELSRPGHPRLSFLQTESGVLDRRESIEPLSGSWRGELDQRDGLLVLMAPYRCGIRTGLGEFLFTARIRLQKAFLRCAPRLDEFVTLWKRAKLGGYGVCSMD